MGFFRDPKSWDENPGILGFYPEKNPKSDNHKIPGFFEIGIDFSRDWDFFSWDEISQQSAPSDYCSFHKNHLILANFYETSFWAKKRRARCAAVQFVQSSRSLKITPDLMQVKNTKLKISSE